MRSSFRLVQMNLLLGGLKPLVGAAARDIAVTAAKVCGCVCGAEINRGNEGERKGNVQLPVADKGKHQEPPAQRLQCRAAGSRVIVMV